MRIDNLCKTFRMGLNNVNCYIYVVGLEIEKGLKNGGGEEKGDHSKTSNFSFISTVIP